MTTGVGNRLLDRLGGELEGEFARVVREAASTGSIVDYREPLADWICRTVTSCALKAAGRSADAKRLTELPGLDVDSQALWEERLQALAEALATAPEVMAYERVRARVVFTVLGVDDCALAFCADAVNSSLRPPIRAVSVASRIIHWLVGAAVADYDHLRKLAMSLPAGVTDGEVEEREVLAERRYRAFFDAEAVVLASLAKLLGQSSSSLGG